MSRAIGLVTILSDGWHKIHKRKRNMYTEGISQKKKNLISLKRFCTNKKKNTHTHKTKQNALISSAVFLNNPSISR